MSANKDQNTNQDTSEVKANHTYQSDLAAALKAAGSKGSFIKTIIGEAKEKEKLATALSPKTIKNRLFILAGALFLIFSFLIIGLTLKKPSAPKEVPRPTALIFTDKTEVIAVDKLNRDKVIELLQEKAATEKDKVTNFLLVKNNQRLSPREFLGLFAQSAPAELASFTTDYMIGQAAGKFFILMKTTRPYDFDLNLKIWGEKIFDDLYELFAIKPVKEIIQTRFTDGFILNRQAKILSVNGQLILGYAFLTDDTIAIATDLLVFEKLNQRILQSQINK